VIRNVVLVKLKARLGPLAEQIARVQFELPAG
jgi:hypothetical protein